MPRWLIVVTVALGLLGCGATRQPAPHRDPQARYAATVRHASDVLARLDADEPAADVRARRAAAACLPDWRAAPRGVRSGPLERFWEVTVTRDAHRTLRVAEVAMLRAVRAMPADTRVVVLGRGIRAGRIAARLAAQIAYDDARYAGTPDACTAVRAWRRDGWARSAMPAAISRIVGLERRAARLLRPRVDVGVALTPDHGGTCHDAVFATLAPGDTFCG